MLCSEETLIEAIKRNTSIAGVLRDIGYSHQRTGYALVHQKVAQMGLDTSHWKAHGVGKAFPVTIPTPELFVLGSERSSKILRGRILKEKLIPPLCQMCGIGPEWNGLSLTLQLDHINGNRKDNRLENLRFICPNCHTQTETFGTRGLKKPKTCSGCGAPVHRHGVRCRHCSRAGKFQIEWPDEITLEKMVQSSSISKGAKQLGVTWNGLKKHLVQHHNKTKDSMDP